MIIHPRTRVASPSIVSDGSTSEARADRTGALHTRNEERAWLEEGTYFRATNVTPGTGIAMGIQTAFSDTANVLLLMRSSSTTTMIVPHYIKLVCTAAGASTTQSNVVVAMDTANRYSTGGTDLTPQIVSANSGAAPASSIDLLRYSCTAVAAVARRVIGQSTVKVQTAPAWAVGDELVITFNDAGDSAELSGATPRRFVTPMGHVALRGQNHCLLVHLWNVANATTAPSFMIDCAWWERS